MKRATLLLVSLLAASMFAFIACDDEPTQQEANEQFCDDMAEFVASLRVAEGPRQRCDPRGDRSGARSCQQRHTIHD